MYKVFSIFSFVFLVACSGSKLNNTPKFCLRNSEAKMSGEYSSFLRVQKKSFKIESFLTSKEGCVGLFLAYYKSKEVSTTEKVVPILKIDSQVLFYNPVNEDANKSIISRLKSELAVRNFMDKDIDSIEQRFLRGIFVIYKN